MLVTVNPAALDHPDVVAHFSTKRDASYRTGMRFALEVLGIPLPVALERAPQGRRRTATPSRSTILNDRRRAMAKAGQASIGTD